MNKVKSLSQQNLSLLLAIYIGIFLNLSVFYRRFDSLAHGIQGIKLISAVTEVIAIVLFTFFIMRLVSLGGRLFYRIVASLLVLISVAASYYMTFFNVVIGYGIVVSVMTTDIDLSKEVVGLHFVLWMVALSALPLLLIWKNSLRFTLIEQLKTPGHRIKPLLVLLAVVALVWLPLRMLDDEQSVQEKLANVDLPSYGGVVAHSYLPSNWLSALGLFAYTRYDESQDQSTLFDPGKHFTYVPPADAGPVDSGVVDCANDKKSPGALFTHLSCETLYSNILTKTIAPANEPYKPSREFWSDGAVKSRWVSLPAGTKIDATDPDEWVYPVGTKLFKEFVVEGKRIETRLYWKDTMAWKHASYRWNADETEATKSDSNELVPVPGKRDYEIPNSGQCDECHMGHKEPVLGFEMVGLGLPGATGVTLAQLATSARIDPVPPSTTFEIPDDGTGKMGDALGWMHANCGACHTRNTGGQASFTGMYLRLKVAEVSTAADPAGLDAVTTSVCVAASSGRTNDAGAPFKRIAPMDPSTSLTSYFSGVRTPVGTAPGPNNQMPPLITHTVDEMGHAQLDAWITAIQTVCP